MNKLTCLTIITIIYLLLSIGSAAAAIRINDPDNPHNLSSGSNNAVEATTETRICVFCHTPHGAVAETALWNREDPDMMGSFPLYSSATLRLDDAAVLTAGSEYNTTDYPNGASRLCLSCHDGVTSIGTVINGSAIGMTFDTLNAYGSGTIDLATSHPISFVYNVAVKDAINTAEITAGGTGSYQLSANSKVQTEVGADSKPRMQCTTCHDPHSDTKNGTYELPFWANYNGDDTKSAADYDGTCQACHQGTEWGGTWLGVPPATPAIH